MLRDITLGQYYPEQSLLHRMDPRVKLMGTLIFIISLFLNRSWIGYGVIIFCFLAVVKLSKVPMSFIFKGLKPVLILVLFSAGLNIFMTDGTVLVRIWKLRVTLEGVQKAVFFSMRIILLVLGSSILTLTTTPTALTDGLEKGLGFLKRLHFPVHDVAMMMSIALRFIPILAEELDKIMKAQISRGADFESGGIIKKAKSLVPLLVPLLISAFRRAEELAMAMDARCYNGSDKRTKLHPLKYTGADYRAYGVLALYLAGVILLRQVCKSTGWM
jgi:energy-coupling factor transport system permease protein